MSTSSTNLFSNDVLSDYLAQRLASVELSVSRCDDLAELDAMEADVIDGSVVQPVKLHRDDAEFEVAEVRSGLKVSVTIPFDGDSRLLGCRADGQARRGPYATVDDGRWATRKQATITLSREFEGPTSSDEARAWAKDQVDQIQGILEAQASDLETHNATARDKADKIFEARRSVLASAAELRKGLGKGI